MRHPMIASTLIGLLMATSAFAAANRDVKEIEVTMDLDAVTNPAAAKRYANVSVDLKNALAMRLADQVADEGMKINVDLSEVELSNSFSEIAGTADTKLVGLVVITDAPAGSNLGGYDVTVNIDQASVFYPAGMDVTTIMASSDDFYNAMITAFADAVVIKVNE